MKFAYPEMLFLMWVVAIAAGFIIYGIKKQKQILSGFASKASLHSIGPEISFTRKWIKGLLIIIAMIFLVFAISGPLLGYKWKKIEQKGVDIMIALDCSRSMLCEDIKPSRLKRAKREIIDLLQKIKSDRAGLVAFSGEAVLQCPLTLDHNAFNIFLDVLEPDYLPVNGTNIGGALQTCIKSFDTDSNSSKAIILITDGENTADIEIKEIVKKASEQGIKIFCIGMGSKDGAPIPDKKGGFKKDKNQNLVISKVDEEGLKELASLGNGRYVRSVTGDMDLDIIYSEGIRANMEKKTLKSHRQKVWENRFQWFLLPCIIMLLAEIIISRRKSLKSNANLILILAASCAISMTNAQSACAGIGSEIQVGSDVKEGIEAFEEQNFPKAEKKFIDAQLKDPENKKLYYNIGTASYKNQDYESALKNFNTALKSSDPDLKHRTLFNMANTKYRLGRIEQAIEDYEKILEEHPSDKLARENLEFVKKKLEEKKKQEQEKKEDKNNTKDKKQDNQNNKGKNNQQKEDKQKNNENQNQDKKQSKKEDKQPELQAGAKEKKQDAKPGKQNMLNRLSDKPGKAMMPIFKKRSIEKDW